MNLKSCLFIILLIFSFDAVCQINFRGSNVSTYLTERMNVLGKSNMEVMQFHMCQGSIDLSLYVSGDSTYVEIFSIDDKTSSPFNGVMATELKCSIKALGKVDSVLRCKEVYMKEKWQKYEVETRIFVYDLKSELQKFNIEFIDDNIVQVNYERNHPRMVFGIIVYSKRWR